MVCEDDGDQSSWGEGMPSEELPYDRGPSLFKGLVVDDVVVDEEGGESPDAKS